MGHQGHARNYSRHSPLQCEVGPEMPRSDVVIDQKGTGNELRRNQIPLGRGAGGRQMDRDEFTRADPAARGVHHPPSPDRGQRVEPIVQGHPDRGRKTQHCHGPRGLVCPQARTHGLPRGSVQCRNYQPGTPEKRNVVDYGWAAVLALGLVFFIRLYTYTPPTQMKWFGEALITNRIVDRSVN